MDGSEKWDSGWDSGVWEVSIISLQAQEWYSVTGFLGKPGQWYLGGHWPPDLELRREVWAGVMGIMSQGSQGEKAQSHSSRTGDLPFASPERLPTLLHLALSPRGRLMWPADSLPSGFPSGSADGRPRWDVRGWEERSQGVHFSFLAGSPRDDCISQWQSQRLSACPAGFCTLTRCHFLLPPRPLGPQSSTATWCEPQGTTLPLRLPNRRPYTVVSNSFSHSPHITHSVCHFLPAKVLTNRGRGGEEGEERLSWQREERERKLGLSSRGLEDTPGLRKPGKEFQEGGRGQQFYEGSKEVK